MKKKTRNNLIYTISIIVFALGFIWLSQNNNQDYDAVVYKSPTCSCCRQYISYLEREGYNIKSESINDMQSVKEKYDISPIMESCHTMIINDYVVEGHVPIEVVKKLLTEKPNIAGISLPDMPAGSPGMPGIKKDSFIIYSLAQNNPVYMNY
jgi:hypothetical protein